MFVTILQMSLTDFMINFPFLSLFILNRKNIYKILTITFLPTANPEKTKRISLGYPYQLTD